MSTVSNAPQESPVTLNVRPAPDALLVDIARYVDEFEVTSRAAFESARLCLMDALGCAMQAFEVPECTKLLGPTVAGTVVPHGARVPGTPFRLDPVKAAFDTSCLVRWLDFNDTWWAGGHPSDNLGAILALADHLSRVRVAHGRAALKMRDVYAAMTKAYEIQGALAVDNALDVPGIGIDSTFLVRIASTAVATHMLGGTRDEIVNALSNAFIDTQSLNLYRLGAHAGSRKSWAAADATSRGVQLALLALKGEMGYPSALSAPRWGFHDVRLGGKPFRRSQPLGTRVIERVQFKIAFPAQRHSQTAAEAATRLHPRVKDRLGEIARVVVATHGLAKSKIAVTGPLPNYAARDHCLQYIVAVALIHGEITTASYTDGFAADPRIDALREKIEVAEDPEYTRDYYDTSKCANANAVQVFFKDGSHTEKIAVMYLLGDHRRRAEGIPLLEAKFRSNLGRRFAAKQQAAILALFGDPQRLEATPVNEFMDALSTY